MRSPSQPPQQDTDPHPGRAAAAPAPAELVAQAVQTSVHTGSAAALERVETQINVALWRAPVLCSDETSVRQAGHLAYVYVVTTARLTHCAVHVKRVNVSPPVLTPSIASPTIRGALDDVVGVYSTKLR